MGSIGHKLPKVLWPVFEKTLLELQVAYAKSLGIQNIYINLHYMGEQIESYCKSSSLFEDVKFLWERPEILDIGGAVHNLAAQPEVKYKGKLLVLNADQFFYLTKDELYRHLEPYAKAPVVLFSYWVNAGLGYNALDISPGRIVKGIIENKNLDKTAKVETYTGNSLIDLSKLEKVPGKSNFWESVCTFKNKEIPAVVLENVDYWDFGTAKRYWETTFRLLATYKNHSTHPFLRFLVNARALKTWKIDLQNLSYYCKDAEVINLGADPLTGMKGPAIILEGRPASGQPNMIYWNELGEPIT